MKDLDQLFKNALENHTELPSPKLWEAIDERLNTLDSQPTKRKTLRHFYLRWGAVAATVALIATVLWPSLTPEFESNENSGLSVEPSVETQPTQMEEGGSVSPNLDPSVKTARSPSVSPQNNAMAAINRAPSNTVCLAKKTVLINPPSASSPTLKTYAVADLKFRDESPSLDVQDFAWTSISRAEEQIGHWIGITAKRASQITGNTIKQGVVNWSSARTTVDHTIAALPTIKTPKD